MHCIALHCIDCIDCIALHWIALLHCIALIALHCIAVWHVWNLLWDLPKSANAPRFYYSVSCTCPEKCVYIRICLWHVWICFLRFAEINQWPLDFITRIHVHVRDSLLRDRDKDRQRQTDNQRQIDRQTERDIESQTGRRTDIKTQRETTRKTDRQTEALLYVSPFLALSVPC